jgi:ATP-dependent helicase/nuclease subunit A
MKLRHVMILASAGSGKTYALTNRFVALLAAGASAERIVALTFTRKAAGEFFDEILNKLARAARDEPFAARLATQIEQPEYGTREFLRLLRQVVDAMPRLRLGTLDGFFARIARAFPLELGLTGEFEILQEHAGRIERRRVLQRMFAHANGGLDAAQREFIEAFKRATFGTEEKQLAARLDGFLDEHQENFLAAPLAACWGDPGRIWPAGCEWLASGSRLAEAMETLRTSLRGRALPERQWARWEAFFDALPEWTAGAPLPRAIEYILKNALEEWRELERGTAAVLVERKRLPLAAEECRALAAIVRRLVGAELTRRLETTRGIHAILHGYEAVYHEAVRRGGRLTFADVQRLLMPDREQAAWHRGAEENARLLIDYRLDAHFDHWLLDEFQDTSHGQWSVLRNLIDEAVQDDTGSRSFFCVGDVKQAIYTWREGDPRLFREIYEHYNRAQPGTIVEEHLDKSWRSGPAVIEMVNAIFGRAAVLSELFPGEASKAWNREWRPHESAHPGLAGQAAWLHARDETERFALTLRLLQEIAPLERGLDCAVLTQTNSTATALADFLRREGGIPALAESDLHIATDNPVGAVLLSLIQAAAHPGDTLAQEHLRMTPLHGLLADEGIATPEALTQHVLAQIHGVGFERTTEYWLRRLERTFAADDAFSRERGRQFLAAAALFDATGSRDAAEFVAFMQRHVLRGAEVAGVVRVMTVHKSKGLGFDVVIVPDLEGQRIDQRRSGLAVQRAADRSVDWVLDLPAKLFHAQDAVLSAHVRAAEAEACYEAFALLYVALTRAKRALYVIARPAGTSASRNYPKLLASTLGGETRPVRVGGLVLPGGWSSGGPEWHVAIRGAQSDVAAPARESGVEILPRGATGVKRRTARRPSRQEGGVIAAAQLFALEGSHAAEFGTQVHLMLADIEWGGGGEESRWRECGFQAAAIAEVRGCLDAAELADLWRRRAGAEVWRERAFEIVLDGVWLTGVFDRVVVEREPRRVTVIDFKTDRVSDEAAMAEAARRHAGQVNLYRRVAAAFAGVPATAVECELVFTHLRRRVRVPAE